MCICSGCQPLETLTSFCISLPLACSHTRLSSSLSYIGHVSSDAQASKLSFSKAVIGSAVKRDVRSVHCVGAKFAVQL